MNSKGMNDRKKLNEKLPFKRYKRVISCTKMMGWISVTDSPTIMIPVATTNDLKRTRLSCRRMIWLLSNLLPHPRQKARPAIHRKTEKETHLLTGKGGTGGVGDESHDGEKA